MEQVEFENMLITFAYLFLLIALGCLLASFIWRDMDKREADGKAVREQREQEYAEQVEAAGMRVKLERWRYKLGKWEKDNHIKEALMAAAEHIDVIRSGIKRKSPLPGIPETEGYENNTL